jgi:hypothetical protein
VKEEDIEDLLKKLEAMWPILKNNEEHKESIVLLVNEKARHVSSGDVLAGYRTLVREHPTGRKDGSPAWPPSPSDVLGCILFAYRDRKEKVKITVPNTGPKQVAGRLCRKCSGSLTFHPGDRIIYCESCRAVQAFEGRAVLTPHDVHSLKFVDKEIDHDETEREREKAMNAIRRMGIK